MAKAETQTKTKVDKSSNSKLKFAIVSVNANSNNRIKEILSNKDVEIVAIVDSQLEKAENFRYQNKIKKVKIYRSEKDLIIKEKLHAVFDFKPDTKIIQSISKFLEQGIDVIIEKPKSEEVDSIIREISQKTNCKIVYRDKLIEFENKGKIYYMK